MSPLLHSLLARLQAIPTHEWHRTAVVFPSRRAGVAFRKLLAENIEKPVFSPNILTLSEWLCRESGWQLADATQLQFDLYEAYLEYEPDEPLESFLHWAPKVLSDFSEVDAYLLDANQVFGYLSQEKAIDLWSPERGQLDAYASQFLAFYSRLGGLYARIHEKALNKQLGWQSLIARTLSEKCALGTHQPAYDHYFFAGFNALSKAESTLFKHWAQHHAAQLLFEADEHYLAEEHEAGLFLRSYQTDAWLGKDILVGQQLAAGNSRITVADALGNSAQVQFAAQQIRQWLAQGVSADEMVVVLANEQLLIPMLQALPENLPAVNVSMGYPFTESHAYSYLLAWSQWIEPLAENKAAYLPHLLALLKHPFMQQAAAATSLQALLKSGRMWIDANEAKERTQTLVAALGLKSELVAYSPLAWVAHWQELLQAALKASDKLQEAMCLQAIVLLRKLSIQLHRFPALNAWRLFKPFLQQSSKNEQVAFLGEPLQGLQVMGLLETRALAFRHVLVVGMNEGTLPKAQPVDGFITYTLRREFQLPGAREKEAVFAYHFYRLLQHAHEAVLLYNSGTDDFGQSEASRYLAQLRTEWKGVELGNFYESSLQLATPSMHLTADITIEKTPEIQKQISDLLQQKLSPSALQLYISCPLRFYFGRVLRLRVADDPMEELQANEIGEVLHEVLELLYKPHEGQPLLAQTIDSLRQQATPLLFERLAAKFPYKDFGTGINLLIAEVCKSYLDTFLELETEWSQNNEIKVEEQELNMLGSLSTSQGVVQLYGKADRIDRLNGQLRIIDYKTGKFDEKEMKLQSAEELLTPGKSKAFQLLAYAWLYRAQKAPVQLPEVGIMSFRMMRQGPKMLEITDAHLSTALDWFEEAVRHIVDELSNSAVPITQTTELKTCQYCDFKGICNR